ncbi:MAG: DUF424 family protein [Candidatus Anstonellaceae archaeon]
MYLKVHHTPMGSIVALCDAELIGRVLVNKKYRLDLRGHASFYQGKLVGKEEAVAALTGAENVNIVGKKALSAAASAGLAVSHAVTIDGIPHLQAYKIV